jgi:hypothetical protein
VPSVLSVLQQLIVHFLIVSIIIRKVFTKTEQATRNTTNHLVGVYSIRKGSVSVDIKGNQIIKCLWEKTVGKPEEILGETVGKPEETGKSGVYCRRQSLVYLNLYALNSS